MTPSKTEHELEELLRRRDILERTQRFGTFTADIVADYDALLAERKRLRDLLREIVNAGIAFEIPGRYHEVQIDSRTWSEARSLLAEQEATE